MLLKTCLQFLDSIKIYHFTVSFKIIISNLKCYQKEKTYFKARFAALYKEITKVKNKIFILNKVFIIVNSNYKLLM